MTNEWWRGGVIYQIYPRSYKDTNADGIGDLKGITEKLDYIASLGVEGIWISPFFRSPMKDFGYDVSDYRDIDPIFGTIGDFKTLLAKAHDLGLKIIIDMVLSHTSDQHQWFKESRESRDNPKSDWYVWASPKEDGTPPNNWVSVFGGSAWTYNVWRGQYYLHQFLKEQPDLNLNNPEVANALLDECRFWLELGVDGMRLDAVNHCTSDPLLRDNPSKSSGLSTQLDFTDPYGMQSHLYDKTQASNLEFMKKIRALLDEYPGTFAVAEIGDDNPVPTAASYVLGDEMLHTAYSFAMMSHQGSLPQAAFFKDIIEEQISYGEQGWPSWAFSNHDVVRASSRWWKERYGHDPALSKLLIAMLGSFRGTAFLYQGEELGLPDVQIPFDKIQDPWGKYLYPRWQGRDGCRTPMPWNSTEKHAGFSQGTETWLPIPDVHEGLSAAVQEKDKNSTLNFTRTFLKWRAAHPLLKTGAIKFIDGLPPQILGFKRHRDGKDMICLFNLSDKSETITHDSFKGRKLESFALSSMTDNKLTLNAYGLAYLI